MIIILKQMAGRLIRTKRDRGAVVICDSRIRTKRYGKAILASLPPFTYTAEPSDIGKILGH